MLLVKICLIIVLGIIFYQDYRSRMVAVLWFGVTVLLFGGLHFSQVYSWNFLVSVGFNLSFIAILSGVLWLYSRYKLKTAFINGSLGLGDLLFFIAVATGFPTVTFMVLFTFSVFFSLIVHLLLASGNFQQTAIADVTGGIPKDASEKSNTYTIPLAGYMSLFFILIFLYTIFCDTPSLYLT